jgi:hypothetical protein
MDQSFNNFILVSGNGGKSFRKKEEKSGIFLPHLRQAL